MKPWHHVPIPMFQDDDSQRSQNKANMYNWWKRSSKGGNNGAQEWNIVSLSLSHSRAVWSVVMCISQLPRHRSKDEVRIFSYNLTKINNPWTETSTSPPFPGFQAKVPVLRISGSLFLIIPTYRPPQSRSVIIPRNCFQRWYPQRHVHLITTVRSMRSDLLCSATPW